MMNKHLKLATVLTVIGLAMFLLGTVFVAYTLEVYHINPFDTPAILLWGGGLETLCFGLGARAMYERLEDEKNQATAKV